MHEPATLLTRFVPSDYFVLSKLKLKMMGQQYETIDDTEVAMISKLNSVRVDAFQKAFTDL